ncbi:three component ABC system middle component [uncultured Bartonella sp.]|uniref:three component ABC system middle component n=1 Tax=uncultured Bartonella sp. TaxID=104108 RepID=UPI0025F7EDA6|nr:three component ABC system middle component [uncultured Bartonella sp.]
MKRWDFRPFEIKYLLNPAFCGLLLVRALEGYESVSKRGMPFSLLLLILALCLPSSSRNIILDSKRSYLLKIIEERPEILIDLPERARELIPYTYEAMGLLLFYGCISIDDNGCFSLIKEKIKRIRNGTDEVKQCLKAALTIGKMFAQVGSRSTIYISFGVRP